VVCQVILYSEAITLSDNYVPFGELGGAVLRMLARTRGVRINDTDLQELKEAVATMPPHPEVPGALVRLREAGFRLYTLTNNPKQPAHGSSRRPESTVCLNGSLASTTRYIATNRPARYIGRLSFFFRPAACGVVPYRLSYVGYSGSSGGWVEKRRS